MRFKNFLISIGGLDSNGGIGTELCGILCCSRAVGCYDL